MDQELIEGRDYYVDSMGRLVHTEYYLRQRGYCCGLGCRHCPYGFVGEGAAKKGKPGEGESLPGGPMGEEP